MKYRRLSDEELKELEKEFINFLAANSMTGPDWEKLKTAAPEKAEQYIVAFSDIVMQKVLERIEHIQLITPKDWKMFHCQKDQIELLGLAADPESDTDFTTQQMTPEVLEQLSMYSAEKAYTNDREAEIFQMLENGCALSDGKFYSSIKKSLEGLEQN